MFEGWELQFLYRLGELIKGIGSLVMEYATKKRERLQRSIRAKELPPAPKPE